MSHISSKIVEIPTHMRGSDKVIGHFSYSRQRDVFCDGDACVIADTEEKIRDYLKRLPSGDSMDIIKKTRFGEIVKGLRLGAAYAFDQGAYSRFFDLAKINGLNGLPEKESFSESGSATEMHFIRIQISK
jgi:hypothetical protein